MDTTDIIALGALFAAIAGFLFGLWQHWRNQEWKRAEFVAAAFKEFESKPKVRNVMAMLDWDRRSINLLPEMVQPEERFVLVDEPLLLSALGAPTSRGFSRVEVAIRDAMDEFLDTLERFEHYIESGLVTPEEFKPYLRYWVNLIGGNGRRNKAVRQSLCHYIAHFEYEGVQRLFARYGYDIVPAQTDSERYYPNLGDTMDQRDSGEFGPAHAADHQGTVPGTAVKRV